MTLARTALLSATLGLLLLTLWNRRDGCRTYSPVSGYSLVAHGGGGLPQAFYSQSSEAMDLAVRNGFKMIEIDFWLTNRGILLSHDPPDASARRLEDLLDWMRRNPGVSIVTDFKTGNVRGLTELARIAGPLRSRFIPQIYNPSEYAPVTRLGLQVPVLTLYRVSEPWLDFANSADLQFVTIPFANRDLAKRVRKPVYLHTVNRPGNYDVAGLYTDCLVPRRGR